MAVRFAAQKDEAAKAATATTPSDTEAKLVALAEQLGWFLGTVRGKADGWLESDALKSEVSRVRERAAELLVHVNRGTRSARKAVVKAAKSARKAVAKRMAKKPVVVAKKPSRGLVDAPGKKHRKPPPQVHIGRGIGEPAGKQMGQKSVKGDMRRGRQ